MNGNVRRDAMHRFYFIKPRPNANAEELAKKLIELKSVEQVFLTEGDCGFIIKARFLNDSEPKDVVEYISKRVGSEYGKVISHCEYVKG